MAAPPEGVAGNPQATLWAFLMDPALIIGLALLIASEVLPYTPLKGNGLVQLIINALRQAFPHKTDTDK